MGRVKLQIKRLENTNGRQATYTKRKHGIMKKANELSILCDIDIVLLMFSPTGKPSLCKGKHSIEEVIEKFAQLTPQERAKRKLESLEALKKTFKKLDHDVNIPEFLGTSSPTVEELGNQSELLQNQLSQVHKRLSYWTEPDKINSLEILGQLENSVKESLDRIQAQKKRRYMRTDHILLKKFEKLTISPLALRADRLASNLQHFFSLCQESLGKQPFMSLDCSSQFQNARQFPYKLGIEQQLSPQSWIPSNDNQHIVLPDDRTLVLHRDSECSASSSFGSYSGFFGTERSSELPNPGQESAPSGMFNDLRGTASLSLQLAGHYPYMPYNPNMQHDARFQPATEMNLQQFPVPCQANGIFEAPKFGYDTTCGGWASMSGMCPIPMFDAHLYTRQPN